MIRVLIKFDNTAPGKILIHEEGAELTLLIGEISSKLGVLNGITDDLELYLRDPLQGD